MCSKGVMGHLGASEIVHTGFGVRAVCVVVILTLPLTSGK